MHLNCEYNELESDGSGVTFLQRHKSVSVQVVEIYKYKRARRKYKYKRARHGTFAFALNSICIYAFSLWMRWLRASQRVDYFISCYRRGFVYCVIWFESILDFFFFI